MKTANRVWRKISPTWEVRMFLRTHTGEFSVPTLRKLINAARPDHKMSLREVRDGLAGCRQVVSPLDVPIRPTSGSDHRYRIWSNVPLGHVQQELPLPEPVVNTPAPPVDTPETVVNTPAPPVDTPVCSYMTRLPELLVRCYGDGCAQWDLNQLKCGRFF